MTCTSLTVLIPSHSLEDFPQQLDESQAESLLNAFAVLWHPAFLAAATDLPAWDRADEPATYGPGTFVIVPTASNAKLRPGWLQEARQAGALVITDLVDRPTLLNAALATLDARPDIDSELVHDFLALGHCTLQTQLLARYMRHFDIIDRAHLHREATAAARAALAGDRTAAETHLKYSFEVLLQAREKFYPVDCYLMELCLYLPRLADDQFHAMLKQPTTFNLLATGADLDDLARRRPDDLAALRLALHNDQAEVLGGEWQEVDTPLLPLESSIWQLTHGVQRFQHRLGRRPTTWGRWRFGLGPHVPQLIHRAGMEGALHFVLDEGIYPEQEQSLFRWEGRDGTIVDACSRIPVAADSAGNILRLAERLAESMDFDHTAGLVLVRWPALHGPPWLDHLHRMARYAPVLGKFVTFDGFFQSSDMPGRLATYKAREYLTPFLVRAVLGGDADPVTRYPRAWQRRLRFDAAEWCAALHTVLTQGTLQTAPAADTETLVEHASPGATRNNTSPADAPGIDIPAIDSALAALGQDSARRLAEYITTGGDAQPGVLLVNPLSFARTVSLTWPDGVNLPAAGDAVVARQIADAARHVVAKVPACGFQWIPAGPDAADPPRVGKLPMAEDFLLRNDLFEVSISDVTGGIGQIRTYKRSPNRLSQQLAYHFEEERTVASGEGADADEYRTSYSEMRLREQRVLSTGPAFGEIETVGDLVDPVSAELLATYRQRVRVWRGRPVIELDIELDVHARPTGNPWKNYIATRFAWKDTTADLSRASVDGIHPIDGRHVESPQSIEIADGEFRTTILPLGLPFHRLSGNRMLDTLLVTPAETTRRFRMVIAIDEPFPLQAARDVMSPIIAAPSARAPAAGREQGWFFHLNTRSVQITRILPLLETPTTTPDANPTGDTGNANPPGKLGYALRLVETEGDDKPVRLHCYRTPTSARWRNFAGDTIHPLSIEDDTVVLPMHPYEICDVELHFDPDP